jgi:site-specific DNA-methyltransferase (adenine-specific)
MARERRPGCARSCELHSTARPRRASLALRITKMFKRVSSSDEQLYVDLERGGHVDLRLADALQEMHKLPDAHFDLAIVDPPYGASTDANWHLPAGHELPGFGGSWTLADHEWDRLEGATGFQFTLAWLAELKRLVRPAGSIWVHGTYHNAGINNVAAQVLGLEIINEVVWYKRNAFPNLSGRRLTASHESILWLHTGGPNGREYRFNYEDAKLAEFAGDQMKKPGKQMRTVWDVPNNKSKDELRYGRHPTQKPLRISDRLLLVAGTPGGRLLVPFAGSGTELIAAIRYGMSVSAFEIDRDAFELASRRVLGLGKPD